MPHQTLKRIPPPNPIIGLYALKRIWQRRSIIGALECMHERMGDVFGLTMPGFDPVMLVGPKAARFVLVTSRDDMRWRIENEPITLLLRHGVLVEDGQTHLDIRRELNPSLHRQMIQGYIEAMWRCTDQVIEQWRPGQTLDMLVEMRKIALLILTDTLFNVDFSPEMSRLWRGVLQAVNYISPGPWVIWRGLSSWGYNEHLKQIDEYLFRIIALRRENVGSTTDMLGSLIAADMSDDLIRDQLMTMLIAGHDTSTATLSWTLYLLGQHPHIMVDVTDEVTTRLNDTPPQAIDLKAFVYLGQVVDESLRLYPPIHLGSRMAARELEFNGFRIPEDKRVLYSIYLTHRHPVYWDNPNTFKPQRFETRPEPYTYLPFGGGPRNCLGAAFAQVETKVVLARILQRYKLRLVKDNVRPHMSATLEPRPGVMMQVLM